ncbi:hypothetical protein [Jidongwangia harbinensis]|uniref:hypothetical protein n=1 Tax=Jidongwangia harbinensis TaxID=2878561 RepID=UPI001CD96D32|nr:hypothetical protein [Jidongwangia harbinensis]MCA2213869.1 hypothetical protein [Jidongwangia harbinensis]
MRANPIRLGVLIALVVVALQALLVPLFAGPAGNLAPRDLPLAVAGPPPAVAALTGRLESGHPGAFAVTVVADGAAADAAIRDRDVYGALVLGPAGPELRVASGASPTVATLLTQAAAGLGDGTPVPVRDVVPADADDPRGTGFASSFLPLAMTAMLAGVLIFLQVRRRSARLLALGTFAVLAGLAGAAVQQYWLGVLPGDYLPAAGVVGLFSLAVAATVTGLGAVADRAGVALGAVTVFLVGNALSAVGSAAELLPQPWGEIGQWLPIGAGGTLLRSAAFFGGNGGAAAAWLLTGYAVVGLLLVAGGRRGLAARSEPVPAAPEPEHALAR